MDQQTYQITGVKMQRGATDGTDLHITVADADGHTGRYVIPTLALHVATAMTQRLTSAGQIAAKPTDIRWDDEAAT